MKNKSPKKVKSLKQQVKESKPLYSSNEAALNAFKEQVKSFEAKYNRDFEDLWLEAENSSLWTEDMNEIHSLQRKLQMINYLINKNEAQLKKT